LSTKSENTTEISGAPVNPKSIQTEWLKTMLFYAVVFLLIGFLFLIFRPFLVPLGWAGVLAVLCYPWTRKLRVRFGRPRAAAIGTAAVTLTLIIPSLLLTVLVVREGLQAARNVQNALGAGSLDRINYLWNLVATRVGQPGSDLPTILHDNTARIGSFLGSRLGEALGNVALILFELFVTLFALFYFIRDSDAILRALRRALPFEEDTREQILNEAGDLIQASVRVSLFIALVQGFLGGLAFAVVGIHSPVFWGAIMAFMALLPVVGTWPVWVPAVIWLYATGNVWRGSVLLAICAGLVTTIDNILRPLLMSGKARLNGLMIFVGVLGGVAAFGPLGIILGPLLIATAMSLLEAYDQREQQA